MTGAWRPVATAPPAPGWYVGFTGARAEPLRFDGAHWHHTRPTRDLAMPTHWRGFDSLGRPDVPPSVADAMYATRLWGAACDLVFQLGYHEAGMPEPLRRTYLQLQELLGEIDDPAAPPATARSR